jgi:hypothetical protein
MTSTVDLNLDEGRTILEVAVPSLGDKRKMVEWPRKRILLGKECDGEENT